jgi:hypothetical protein
MDVQTTMTYLENRPGKTFRSWSAYGYARSEWNYDGDRITTGLIGYVSGQLLNNWSGIVQVGTTLPGAVDDRLTWGGPLALRPGNWRISSTVSSDQRRPVAGALGWGYQNDDEGGWNYSAYTTLALKLDPRWNLTVSPTVSRVHSGAQYIMTRRDPAAVNTFGARYILSELDQTTLALETRLNVTFTTDLSLQVYAQPFIASADYGTPAELAAPRTYDFLKYGEHLGDLEATDGGYFVYPQGAGTGQSRFFVPNRDFNLRSLRGNAVLRWEWRPGSTMYLAWQQDRSDFAPYVGDFQMSRDRSALFNAQPDNVFVLKVSYWVNP